MADPITLLAIASLVSSGIQALTAPKQPEVPQSAEDKWFESRIKIGATLVKRRNLARSIAASITGEDPKNFSGGSRFKEEFQKWKDGNVEFIDPAFNIISEHAERNPFTFDMETLARHAPPDTFHRREQTPSGKLYTPEPELKPVGNFVDTDEYPTKYEIEPVKNLGLTRVNTYMYDTDSGHYTRTKTEDRDMNIWAWEDDDWKKKGGV